STATARATVRDHAQVLMPETDVLLPGASVSSPVDTGARPRNRKPWAAEERIALAASAHPTERAGGDAEASKPLSNAAGDHNQAMMELGATICLPRAPLCDQ